jgi:hypothetical protein
VLEVEKWVKMEPFAVLLEREGLSRGLRGVILDLISGMKRFLQFSGLASFPKQSSIS